ncbi:MAG: hypothetical protein RL368_724 [Pseudomonadota bacterium]|jgi:type IV pilus assembly protein PilE
MLKKQNGFTLVELMMVVAVIAILSTVAIPAYDQYITKARRADAKVALMKLAQLQEAFFSNNNRYAITLAELLTSSSEGFLNIKGVTAQSPQNYYTLTLNPATARNFTLTATPYGDMITREEKASPSCKGLSIDSTGQRGVSGEGTGSIQDCWN